MRAWVGGQAGVGHVGVGSAGVRGVQRGRGAAAVALGAEEALGARGPRGTPEAEGARATPPTAPGTPGVIHRHYTGEVKVLLINLSKHAITLNKHKRVAQLILKNKSLPEVEEVYELGLTTRGDHGFGSTHHHCILAVHHQREHPGLRHLIQPCQRDERGHVHHLSCGQETKRGWRWCLE